jgi:hypothetical protein
MDKIYKGRIDPRDAEICIVDHRSGMYRLPVRLDLANHSPDGFAWGYHGSGPAQLALALLADALEDDARALRLYHHFKNRVIARLPKEQEWTMTRAQIWDHVRAIEEALSPMNDHDAMLAIQECLDGVEWSSETLDEIAGIVVRAGYRVRDCNENDQVKAPGGFREIVDKMVERENAVAKLIDQAKE